MNKVYISVLLVCSVVIGLISIGASYTKKGADRSKDIIFSHKFHVKDGGVGCTDCHLKMEESDKSSDNLLPTMQTCYNCHDEKTTECSKCHPDTTDYRAFTNPVRDFSYSHKKHLGLDSVGITCTGCHIGLDEVDLSYKAPKALPEMDLCFACHNNGSGISEYASLNTKKFAASKNCEICHTDLSNLKPKSHLAGNFKKEHSRLARVGSFDSNCETCHTENFCQNCHNGSPLLYKRDLVSNATSDKSPKPENLDGPNKMIIQNVHSLNYIMVHSFDARSKKTECFTCHEEQSFCNECHKGADGVEFRQKPKWHNVPAFTTMGRNSGGGEHARYAKREIETCMSCHDTEGADPVCVMCHRDADGVKGTDPRTHSSRDFSHEGGLGIWMNNEGAVCYDCHTDMYAKNKISGKGFCGYCHGSKR